MRIVELLVDDAMLNSPEVGIDGIALVKNPAHMENWLAFNQDQPLKQPYEVLTDEQMDELAHLLSTLGEDEDSLLQQGYEIYKVQELSRQEFVGQIVSTPNDPDAEEDTPYARIRYKYVGPKDEKNRPFCAVMMRSNKVFTRENIQTMSNNEVNEEISRYSGYYDIFEWRGSYNCRHRWVKLYYKPIEQGEGIARQRILDRADSTRNLIKEEPVPARDTTTAAAGDNGYNALAFSIVDIIDNYPLFDNREEAEQISNIIGCKGVHIHKVQGREYFMPCEKHPEQEQMEEAIYDVPQYARDKACKARKYKEENPSVDCGTRVGWTRSAQLCNGDKVSRDIIARMSAFGRHLSNAEKQKSYDEGCALLMVDAWGGKEGIEWAAKELERIDKKEFLDPNPCQSGWVAYGTKIKDGKTVPNCIPETKANQIPKLRFSYDDEKMEITGAALIPNKLIIRSSPTGEPYYVYFSEDTVKKLAYKFMKEKRLDSTNIEHTSIIAKDTYVVESWIVEDEEDDKSNALGLKYPKGSWIITMKVDSPKVWGEIKSGKYAGFSIEGYFEEKSVFSQEDILVNTIKKLINETYD